MIAMTAAAPIMSAPSVSLDDRANVAANESHELRSRLLAAYDTGKPDAVEVAKAGIAVSHAVERMRR